MNYTEKKNLTVANLRELANRAANRMSMPDNTLRFDMDHFYANSLGEASHLLTPRDVSKPECGSSLCLIGLAAAMGMGEPEKYLVSEIGEHNPWARYSDSLFPLPSMSMMYNDDVRIVDIAEISEPGHYEDGSVEVKMPLWQSVFGCNLKSDLDARVAGLRTLADEIEAGEFDTDDSDQ